MTDPAACGRHAAMGCLVAGLECLTNQSPICVYISRILLVLVLIIALLLVLLVVHLWSARVTHTDNIFLLCIS